MALYLMLAVTLAITLAAFQAIWRRSVTVMDASIIDLYWGPGFAVIAWSARAMVGTEAAHGWWLAVLSTTWGARLGIYLWWRGHGRGEDRRYAAMRQKHGGDFAQFSLWWIFRLQAVLQWLIALPLALGQTSSGALGFLAVLGIALFLVGFAFETIADAQLAAFKADPGNAERVMDQGLWAWSRHPNYFGEACLWWGLGLIAIDGTGWWLLALSPALMTFLLLRVSGVTLLEADLARSKPGYRDYIARTSAFIPRRPDGF